MSKKALSADLVAAYRATEYRVSAQEPFTLHVDQHSKALAKLYRDTGNTRASFLTADNPFSVTDNPVRELGSSICIQFGSVSPIARQMPETDPCPLGWC